MADEGSEKLILNSVQYELNTALEESLNKKGMTENTINQLEYQCELLEKIDLDTMDQSFQGDAIKLLNLAESVITKYKEKRDNESLIRTTMYLTPKQLRDLDNYADDHTLQGSGIRSQALRLILNEYFTE